MFELLQHPFFFVLIVVLMVTVSLCLFKQQYIPAVLFIILSGLGGFYEAVDLPQVSMLKAILFPLLLFAVLWRNFRLGNKLPLSNFALLLIYIFIIISSSLMYGADLNVYRSSLITLLIPVIVALCPNNEKTLKYLLIAIALWGVANLLVAITEWSGVGWKYGSNAIHTSYRVQGLMGHSTAMGMFFVLSLNAVHVLYIQSKTKFCHIMWFILGIGMLLGLLGTLSRGAIAAWFVSFLFIQYKIRKISVMNILGIVIAAIIIVAVSSIMHLDELIFGRFSTMNVDPSAQARIPLLLMGMELLKINPLFGTGLAQAGRVHLEAHNTYMQVLMETGIFGFSAFCLVMWRCIKGLRAHILMNVTDDNVQSYYVGLLGMVGAILLNGFTHVFDYLVPLWLIVGLGFMVVRKQ